MTGTAQHTDTAAALHERRSNIELYRILLMLLIIAHHYVVNSGLTDPGGVIYSNPLSKRSLFLMLFGAWGKTGINCFLLITGYFMCCSDITARKFVKLLLEIEFYNIVFYLIFLIAGYETFSVSGMWNYIKPVHSVATDFSSCFLIFYLCIPFLNMLVRRMNERQHIKLLILLSFVYIYFGTVSKEKLLMNYVSWFCVLYFIASYIRIYPKRIYENTAFCGVMTLASVAFSAASVLFCAWYGAKTGRNMAFYYVTDSNTVLAVLNGIFSFLFFKNLKIKQSRFINSVAASTFGVLMIHANSDSMRRFIWRDTLNNIGAYSSNYVILHAAGSVLAVFAVCTLIDAVRIRLLERPFFKWFDKHRDSISERYKSLEDKICSKMKIS